jgi:hypothetical protein
MRKYISIFFAALLLSGLPACFYSDSEVYYVEPIPGDPPLLSVSTNLDTLYNPPVNDSLEVIYQLEIAGGEFYYVYAEVAGSPVYESNSTHGSFWIKPSLADTSGVDTLYMEFYYSTNSNSLADKAGYEALIEYLKFAIDFNL